jgi:rod shape-determining protein MreC
MQQLIYFIQKYKYVLFFLLLQCIAIFLTINNHSFHKSKFISSANSIAGGFYNKANNITSYLQLKTENEILVNENVALKNKITLLESIVDSTKIYTSIDTVTYHHQFQYIEGKIIKNEYHKAYNYLTINKGKRHSITQEMAVINHKGIIGTTDAVSTNYARVRSILNRSSEINVRLKNKDVTGNYFYGSISWDGEDHKIVQLSDIPRQANIQIGDTIITSGRSAIFPEGILVGKVSNLLNRSNGNTIDVTLFNDMKTIRDIYIINNYHKKEIKDLEDSSNE